MTSVADLKIKFYTSEYILIRNLINNHTGKNTIPGYHMSFFEDMDVLLLLCLVAERLHELNKKVALSWPDLSDEPDDETLDNLLGIMDKIRIAHLSKRGTKI